jgi:hypothetical protein
MMSSADNLLVEGLPEGHQTSSIQMTLCSRDVEDLDGPASDVCVQFHLVKSQVESGN